jgi:hypothetical protein
MRFPMPLNALAMAERLRLAKKWLAVAVIAGGNLAVLK